MDGPILFRSLLRARTAHHIAIRIFHLFPVWSAGCSRELHGAEERTHNPAVRRGFLAFGPQDILFSRYLVDFRNRKRDLILVFQKVGDLLAAKIPLTFSDRPDELFREQTHLPRRAWLPAGLLVVFQKGRQSLLLNALQPKNSSQRIAAKE